MVTLVRIHNLKSLHPLFTYLDGDLEFYRCFVADTAAVIFLTYNTPDTARVFRLIIDFEHISELFVNSVDHFDVAGKFLT